MERYLIPYSAAVPSQSANKGPLHALLSTSISSAINWFFVCVKKQYAKALRPSLLLGLF